MCFLFVHFFLAFISFENTLFKLTKTKGGKMKKYLFGSIALFLLAGGVYANTKYYSVSCVAFQPTDKNEAFARWADDLHPTELAGTHIFFAPVYLPDSAKLLEVAVWVCDSNTTNDVSLMLSNSSLSTTPAGGTIVNMSSSGSIGYQCLTDTSINPDIIDNSAFSYWLYVSFGTYGSSLKLCNVRIKYELPTAGKEETKTDTYGSLSISQNKPNPSKGVTHITYQLPKKSNVSLKIYDSTGRVVKTLVQEEQDAGPYTLMWNGTDNRSNKVTNGTYFYILESAGEILTRKVIVLQ